MVAVVVLVLEVRFSDLPYVATLTTGGRTALVDF